MKSAVAKKLEQQKAKEARAKAQLSKAKAESKKLHDEIMISLGEEVLKQLHTNDVELAFTEIKKQLRSSENLEGKDSGE